MAKSKPRYGRGTGKLHPVDVHIGARVRQRRTLLGMTQPMLGDVIGLSFQQVQMYEYGTNQIPASRLFDLARVLDVSIEYFFDNMPTEVAASSLAKGRGRAREPVGYDPGFLTKQETLFLVRAYYKIEDADLRKRLYSFTKALGAGAGKDS